MSLYQITYYTNYATFDDTISKEKIYDSTLKSIGIYSKKVKDILFIPPTITLTHHEKSVKLTHVKSFHIDWEVPSRALLFNSRCRL